MRQVFALTVLLCFSVLTQAQIQFWNIADVEDGQWVKARISSKVKQVQRYQTDERGNKLDESFPNEIQQYNSNGQLTIRITYKFDWKTKIWNMQELDSFAYTAAGKLIAFFGFEGPRRNPAYQTQVAYNNKNQQARQDHYIFLAGERKLESYDLFEYDTKGQPKKITLYNADKSINTSYNFLFTNAGKLMKTTAAAFGIISTENYTWNNKGQLLSYQQLIAKDLQRTVNYTYDEKGRLVKKLTTTPTNYDDFTNYFYEGNNGLAAKTYLQYSGTGGKSDRRHEYMQFDYSFLK